MSSPAGAAPAIEATALTKHFGSTVAVAVDAFSFSVPLGLAALWIMGARATAVSLERGRDV